jgi:hypothetical protein
MRRIDTGPKPKSLFSAAKLTCRVLIVAPGKSAATRIGYEVPFKSLSGPDFEWRLIPEYRLKAEDLHETQVLILYRCLQGATLSLVRLARLKRIKVLYELDDDLLDPPDDETWGQCYRRGHLPQVLELFLAEADLVKAGSPQLAQRLTQKGYPAFYQPYAAPIRKSRVKAVGTGAPCYRIGYFGTPHHRGDIESIFPALLTVKTEFQDQVELEFFGCYPRQWRLLQAGIFPYEPDYEVFMDLLAQRGWDLGLAPLRHTRFNEAKSNSKFRDFTAAGILGIYADLAPYRDAVISGQNGWLTGAAPELWAETLRRALVSPGRGAMLQQAELLLRKVYSPVTVAGNWAKLIDEMMKR